MDQFLRDPSRDTILYVNSINARSLSDFTKAVTKLEGILKRKLNVLFVIEKRDKVAVKAEH